MSSRLGRALRGLFLVCLGLAMLPAMAQVRQEGAIPDGRGGVGVLATGISHTCALRANGTASCWGENYDGQSKPLPGTFIELSAGFHHTCGLRGDGRVECWGQGYPLPPPPPPEGVPPPPPPPSPIPEGRYTALASGMASTCGLRVRDQPWQHPEGNVACWTASGWNQLPPPPPGDFVALSLGDNFACGLRANGRAECWGGQMDPQQVPAEDSFIAITAGGMHACGLRADGSVTCWGENWAGQATPPAELFTAIGAGIGHTCGLRTDGRAQCWGDDWSNQTTPPPDRFIALSVGVGHNCAIRIDGTVACWGNVRWNYEHDPSLPPPMQMPWEGVFGMGQLAAGDWHQCQTNPEGRLTCWGGFDPDPAPDQRFSAASSGFDATCARNENGLLQCFGYNQMVQENLPPEPLRQFDLGYEHGCGVLALDGRARCWGRETNGKTIAPEGLFRTQSAGLMHSCGVRADGNGECWGYNGDGQTMVPPPMPGRGFLSLESGERHSCSLDSGLSVRCWGMSPQPHDPDAPWHPSDFLSFRALSVGAYHSCAIRTDGRLLCWGENWNNQLDAPEGTFVAVSAGHNQTCAIRSDGSRECWGGQPWMTPKLVLDPEHLQGVRPGEWLHVQFQLHSESPYPLKDPTYSIVAGTLPWGFRLESDGVLRGSWHETGRYPITVEGRDRNGFVARREYVLSIDDTPPVIAPLLTGTAGDNGWYTSPVDVQWSVTDPESEIRWQHGCNPVRVEYDTFDAGFYCHAESAGGHTFNDVHVKMDLAPPVAWVRSFDNNGTSATIEFEGHDPMSGIAGFECSLDGGAYAPCASPLQGTYAPGMHEMLIRAVDMAGHRSEPTLKNWFTDATPPVITATVTGTKVFQDWYQTDVGIEWSVSDPETGIATLTGCQFTTLTTDTPNATFTCTATNGAGASASQTVSVKRDATKPVINLQGHPAATTNSRDAHFRFAVSDNVSGYWNAYCILDHSPQGQSCSSGEFNAQALRDGEHSLQIWAWDIAGNPAATSYHWVVDTSPPVIWSTFLSGLQTNDNWFVSDVQIRWNVSDLQTAVSSTSGCEVATLTTDSPGTSFTCTATSLGGTDSKTIVVKRDTVAPDTALTAAPALGTSGNATFEFTGSDATSGVAFHECSLDGAEFTTCYSPRSVQVATGNHTFTVRAVDRANHRDASPVVHQWQVDPTPPQITHTVTGTKNAEDWYSGDVRIEWMVTDNESAIVDSSGCTPATLSSDSPNASFTCTAQSAGGSANDTVHVRRDATPPDTSFTLVPDAADARTEGTFGFAGQDATSGISHFECSIDGSPFVTCQPPHPYSVAVGAHTFRVRAVDHADNRDPTPAEYTWVVDGTPPQVTPTVTGTLGSNGWYVGDVQVSWSAVDGDSPITASTGCNTVTVTTDTSGAGLTCSATSAGGTTTRTVTVKRDATAPVIMAAATTAPNAAGWYRADVTVGFACSDALSGGVACPTAQVLGGEGAAIASAARSVTDAAGNSAVSNVVTVKIDRTAPTLAPAVTPGTLLLNANASAQPNANDSLSGLSNKDCAVLAIGSVGNKTVSCSATDAAGNTATASAAYRVVYGFQGFNTPVQNPSVLNVLKAGRSVPLRWRVVDAQGAPVSNLSSASVGAIAISCPSATENRISVFGGSNGQLQNLGNGYYQLDWMASYALRGYCRRLELSLGDGEARPALFKFN